MCFCSGTKRACGWGLHTLRRWTGFCFFFCVLRLQRRALSIFLLLAVLWNIFELLTDFLRLLQKYVNPNSNKYLWVFILCFCSDSGQVLRLVMLEKCLLTLVSLVSYSNDQKLAETAKSAQSATFLSHFSFLTGCWLKPRIYYESEKSTKYISWILKLSIVEVQSHVYVLLLSFYQFTV